MGTDYYMVKDDQKVYVGRNINLDIFEEIKCFYEHLKEKYLWCDFKDDYIYKTIGELSITDYGDIADNAQALYYALQLIDNFRFTAWYIEHGEEEGWELKSDYELEDE